MAGGGDLHIDEEFARAKRNLLWFCSFAILLWMIHVPPDGALVPPMLGISAKLDINWLRGAIWLACLYCFIGFYRQTRNVDRLNSAAVYTRNITKIQETLAQFDENFTKITEQAKSIRDQLSVRDPTHIELDHARKKLEDAIQQAMVEARERYGEVDNDEEIGDRTHPSPAEESAHGMIEAAIKREVQIFSLGQSEKISTMIELAGHGNDVGLAIEQIRSEFNRLSGQIRSDHRLFFTWYDKYLSYGMFTVATMASAWSLQPII